MFSFVGHNFLNCTATSHFYVNRHSVRARRYVAEGWEEKLFLASNYERVESRDLF